MISEGGGAQVAVPGGFGEAEGVARPRRLQVHFGAGSAAGHEGGGGRRGQPAVAPRHGANGLEAEAEVTLSSKEDLAKELEGRVVLHRQEAVREGKEEEEAVGPHCCGEGHDGLATAFMGASFSNCLSSEHNAQRGN